MMTNTCLRSSGLRLRRFAARTKKRRGGSPTGLGEPCCPPRRSSLSCTSGCAGTAFSPRSKPRRFPTTYPSRLLLEELDHFHRFNEFSESALRRLADDRRSQ